jgi:surface polysaccharide O-acyltransferase-like enzyme
MAPVPFLLHINRETVFEHGVPLFFVYISGYFIYHTKKIRKQMFLRTARGKEMNLSDHHSCFCQGKLREV